MLIIGNVYAQISDAFSYYSIVHVFILAVVILVFCVKITVEVNTPTARVLIVVPNNLFHAFLGELTIFSYLTVA